MFSVSAELSDFAREPFYSLILLIMLYINIGINLFINGCPYRALPEFRCSW